MAVEASKVKARLRTLFPKANLSSKRLDEISDKLGKKIEDNATDAQIDEAVTEQNELYSFEEIAKNDDRARTERRKTEPEPKPKEEEQEPTDANEKLLKAIEALTAKVTSMEQEKQAQTLEQRFKSDERLKNVNPVLFKGRIPTSEDGFDEAIEELLKDAQELKLNNYGGDTPASGDNQKPTEVKEISADDANKILASMGINQNSSK